MGRASRGACQRTADSTDPAGPVVEVQGCFCCRRSGCGTGSVLDLGLFAFPRPLFPLYYGAAACGPVPQPGALLCSGYDVLLTNLGKIAALKVVSYPALPPESG